MIDMKDEGVSLEKLERWEKEQKEYTKYLVDRDLNDKKMLEWRVQKLINLGRSLGFTAGLFLLGFFCVYISGIDWTPNQIEYYAKLFVGVLGFLVIWLFVWKITNPFKPHPYYRDDSWEGRFKDKSK
jgi:hypothetical protein